MIIDTILYCENYYKLHPLFQSAFDFIHTKIHDLKDGVYEIDGKNLYVTIGAHELRGQNNVFLECHEKYIDIQFIIDGKEDYGYKNRNYCHIQQGNYNHDTDVLFWDDSPTNYITLCKNDFIILFPQDCHAPLIGHGHVRKAVFKVKIDSIADIKI